MEHNDSNAFKGNHELTSNVPPCLHCKTSCSQLNEAKDFSVQVVVINILLS